MSETAKDRMCQAVEDDKEKPIIIDLADKQKQRMLGNEFVHKKKLRPKEYISKCEKKVKKIKMRRSAMSRKEVHKRTPSATENIVSSIQLIKPAQLSVPLAQYSQPRRKYKVPASQLQSVSAHSAELMADLVSEVHNNAWQQKSVYCDNETSGVPKIAIEASPPKSAYRNKQANAGTDSVYTAHPLDQLQSIKSKETIFSSEVVLQKGALNELKGPEKLPHQSVLQPPTMKI